MRAFRLLIVIVSLSSICRAHDIETGAGRLTLGSDWQVTPYSGDNFGGGGEIINSSRHLYIIFILSVTDKFATPDGAKIVSRGERNGASYYIYHDDSKHVGLVVVFPTLKFRLFVIGLPDNVISIRDALNHGQSLFRDYSEAAQAQLEEDTKSVIDAFTPTSSKPK